MNYGFFITSHGFGHASRACAIIEKLAAGNSNNFFLFTETPKCFFENSLQTPFTYFALKTDVGLVQTDPFNEDLDQTLVELEKYYPFESNLISLVTKLLVENKIEIVVCDISALGIYIADKLQIPSVLIENFTWDWIYQFYSKTKPQLKRYISYLEENYQKATIRITSEPFCLEKKQAYQVSPIFREPRHAKHKVLKDLNFRDNDNIVLISMGGIPIEKFNQKTISSIKNIKFLVPVNYLSQIQNDGPILYLPHNHKFYHPDLVNISKLLIGKVGYSTIAEVYSLRKSFMYIGRENFPESKILENYINSNIVSKPTKLEKFFSDGWYDDIENLMQTIVEPRAIVNGADQVIRIIEENYGSQFQ